jgi:hypothetical protein
MVVHGPYPVGEPRVAREAAAAHEHGYAVEIVAMRGAGEPPREVVDGMLVIRLPVRNLRGAGIGRIIVEYLMFATLAAGVVAKRDAVPGALRSGSGRHPCGGLNGWRPCWRMQW